MHDSEADPLALARMELQKTANFNLDSYIQEQTKYYIDAAMELTQNNISEAAKLLGINRTTLYSRMEIIQKNLKSSIINENNN